MNTAVVDQRGPWSWSCSLSWTLILNKSLWLTESRHWITDELRFPETTEKRWVMSANLRDVSDSRHTAPLIHRVLKHTQHHWGVCRTSCTQNHPHHRDVWQSSQRFWKILEGWPPAEPCWGGSLDVDTSPSWRTPRPLWAAGVEQSVAFLLRGASTCQLWSHSETGPACRPLIHDPQVNTIHPACAPPSGETGSYKLGSPWHYLSRSVWGGGPGRTGTPVVTPPAGLPTIIRQRPEVLRDLLLDRDAMNPNGQRGGRNWVQTEKISDFWKRRRTCPPPEVWSF